MREIGEWQQEARRSPIIRLNVNKTSLPLLKGSLHITCASHVHHIYFFSVVLIVSHKFERLKNKTNTISVYIQSSSILSRKIQSLCACADGHILLSLRGVCGSSIWPKGGPKRLSIFTETLLCVWGGGGCVQCSGVQMRCADVGSLFFKRGNMLGLHYLRGAPPSVVA